MDIAVRRDGRENSVDTNYSMALKYYK